MEEVLSENIIINDSPTNSSEIDCLDNETILVHIPGAEKSLNKIKN